MTSLFFRAATSLSLAFALLTPVAAHAFCRTWSCDPSKGSCPQDPENPVCIGGDKTKHKALYWPQKCIGFSVNEGASQQLDANPDRARAKFARIADLSFATWQKADCGDGKHPSVTFFDLGFIECNRHEFNGYNPDNSERPTAQGNANLITFLDKWPETYKNSGNTLALTTLTFNVQTGEIYDADIEINGDVKISTSDTTVSNDLQSILTHEIGHFLGIAHSPVPDATMFASYQTGSLAMRELTRDDTDAVCAIYKPDRHDLPACDPTPRHGYGEKCAIPSPASDGCSSSPRNSSSNKMATIALASALALCIRRKKLSLNQSPLKRSYASRLRHHWRWNRRDCAAKIPPE